MSKVYVLYNSKAGEKNTPDGICHLADQLNAELCYVNVLELSDYAVFLSALDSEDRIVLSGGDGTLNRFVNDAEGLSIPNEILYYPNGTGNDFAHDLGFERGCAPFSVNAFLEGLPTVTVKDKTVRFLNGVGYGIDGYCCEVGDEMKKDPDRKVNYTSIAIRGLLFHYRPTDATVTVDGKEHRFRKVWLAPTMNGRFYGGV